jgi:hypothetical protein
VRSFGPHTTIGEMGLITRQVRSATIVLYALSFEAYERLKSENRPLHQALLSYVVTVMTESLELRQQGDRRAAPLAQSSPGVKRLDAPDVGCFVASTIEFVLLLEVQPEFWGGSERLSEA